MGKEGPRLETTRFEEGAGGSRGRKEYEDATATRPAGAKKRVKASAESGSASATDRSGTPKGLRRAGKAKMRPSAERWPSGRPAKMSKASCQGAPTRSAWRKVHSEAGYGAGGQAQSKRSGENGGRCTARADQGTGATTMQRYAWSIWHWSGDQCHVDRNSALPQARRVCSQECKVAPGVVEGCSDGRAEPLDKRKQAPKTRRASEVVALATSRKRERFVARAADRRSSKAGQTEATHSG